AQRTLVFVRPNLLVIDDRIGLDQDRIRTTWAAHVASQPELAGRRASARVGASRLDVHVVLPSSSQITAVREPNGGGEGPHRKSSPWGAIWRLEVVAQTGD